MPNRICRFDRAALPFAVALAIALVMRIAFRFDGLYGQDAFAYFQFARAIWPHLLHGAPLPALFWPRGYPAAVAALLPLTGGGPLAGQIVSALAMAGGAAATFGLVLELELERRRAGEVRKPSAGSEGDPTARLVAGLCVAASGVSLRNSQVVMSDGLAFGLTAMALWATARYLRTGRGAWLVPAAVGVAFGAVTRWQIGTLAVPLGAALLSDRPASDGRSLRRWLWLAAAATAGAIIVGSQLLIAHDVPRSFAQHEWLLRWSPLNTLRRSFHTSEGAARYRFPVGVFYGVRLGWPDAFFPTLALLALAGAWSVWRGRRRAEIALLLGWPLVNWAFISGIPYENPRFLWPALPSVAALAGIGFQAWRARMSPRGRAAATGLLAASLAAGLALGAREHVGHTVALKNAGLDLVGWIDAQVPPGTTLLQSGGTMMSEYYGRTPIRDIYLLSPDEIGDLLARACPCFYLADIPELEHRMAGLPPQAVFESLRRAPGLTPVAGRPPYVLFRVGPPR